VGRIAIAGQRRWQKSRSRRTGEVGWGQGRGGSGGCANTPKAFCHCASGGTGKMEEIYLAKIFFRRVLSPLHIGTEISLEVDSLLVWIDTAPMICRIGTHYGLTDHLLSVSV
jgi:hypothetical protein